MGESSGNTKYVHFPKQSTELAEFVGILLGDGNINAYKKGKKVRTYHIKIAGDYKTDKGYHIEYIKPLCEKLFQINAREIRLIKQNERFIVMYGKRLIEFFREMGINPGDKIVNQSTIPEWVYKRKSYIRACLRGLIDTDGSVFRMSRKDPNLIRISFKNANRVLLDDAREAFTGLGFHPSKVTWRTIFISRQSEIRKYLKEIGFSNDKHKARMQRFSPVV